MGKTMQWLCIIGLFLMVSAGTITAGGGTIFTALPHTIEKNAIYVFYLHGRIIETEGRRPTHPRFGIYEYDMILKTLADSGFIVISEARPADTRTLPYAHKVAAQIDSLIQVGVPPSQITVIGASKGAAIAGFVSAIVNHPEVRYVILSICNQRMVTRWLQNGGPFSGHVLYIYETSDPIGQSCQPFFQQLAGSNLREFKEIKLDTGLHHGFLYRPLQEWVEPAVRWAKGLSIY